MRKLLSVLLGTTWTERLMLTFSSSALFLLSLSSNNDGNVSFTECIVLFHAASLVYWVYRASALTQQKTIET